MKIFIWLTAISIVLLNALAIAAAHSTFALYYVFWVGIAGWLIWRHRDAFEAWLRKRGAGGFARFYSRGIIMILIEETLAATFDHGSVFQFWAFNLLALSGFVVGWYFLSRWFAYGRREVFILAGLLGLYAEQILQKVVSIPIFGLLLCLPTMASYMVIIAPSIMSADSKGRRLPAVLRWILGILLPIIASVPFVLALSILKAHFPGAFPGPGLVQ